VRLVIDVLSDDSALVRAVVKALNDPDQRYEVRDLLQRRFEKPRSKGLKAMLATAPLEGIDLSRSRDVGRPVEF
jgi:hypothetical protein